VLSQKERAKKGRIGLVTAAMLGIEDSWVVLAYVLCILSTIVCVLYGILNWNQGDEPVLQEDVDWAQEEKEEIEETL
jgi:hypothetical protein